MSRPGAHPRHEAALDLHGIPWCGGVLRAERVWAETFTGLRAEQVRAAAAERLWIAAIGRMKNYKILRDCRQHSDGLTTPSPACTTSTSPCAQTRQQSSSGCLTAAFHNTLWHV